MQDKKSYIQSAIQTIQTEIAGLESLFDCFNENYEAAIELILHCKGRIIISGMGKSGHIGNKIAATLASTGTPSFFIHPGEASHGDLGMISQEDVVILLSNSGETKELRDIIFYCRRFEIPIIAMVRNADSELVKSSTIAFVLSKIPEANQVNAPTTSTTMMLALGDAIAVSLIDARGFNKEDFGVFHPGGKLGAAFTRVKDIMRKDNHEIPSVKKDTFMSQALIEITSKHLGCTGVVNDHNELIGIITDGDLRRGLEHDLLNKTAQEIMTHNPTTIKEDLLAVDAIALMNKKSITNLFVVDDNHHIKGVLHIHDCLKSGIA